MTISTSAADTTVVYNTPYNKREVQDGLYVYEPSSHFLSKEQCESAVSFTKTYEEALRKAEEKKAKSADFPEYAIAVFDFTIHAPTDIESTGDAKYDKKIREAIAYYNSCFDFTNSADYYDLTAAEDFTGMTKTEKYNAIYEKYQHCYGEEFLMGKAADTYLIPSRYDVYRPIIQQFTNELVAVFGEKGLYKVRREALYGDCEDDYEVREAIIKKYMQNSPDGRLTHRDYYKMTYEMDLCGVGGGISESMHTSAYVTHYLGDTALDDNTSKKFLDSYITQTDIQDIINSFSIVSQYPFDTSNYLPAINQIASAITVDKNSTLKNTIDSLIFNNNLA